MPDGASAMRRERLTILKRAIKFGFHFSPGRKTMMTREEKFIWGMITFFVLGFGVLLLDSTLAQPRKVACAIKGMQTMMPSAWAVGQRVCVPNITTRAVDTLYLRP